MVLATHSSFSHIAYLAVSPLWRRAGEGRTDRRCCFDPPCGSRVVGTFGNRSFSIVFPIVHPWLSDLPQIHFWSCHLLKSLTTPHCLQRWILNALAWHSRSFRVSCLAAVSISPPAFLGMDSMSQPLYTCRPLKMSWFQASWPLSVLWPLPFLPMFHSPTVELLLLRAHSCVAFFMEPDLTLRGQLDSP